MSACDGIGRRPATRKTADGLTPVTPRHVHKNHAEEVYLTHWRSTGRDRFFIRARRPGAHDFYRVGKVFDPLLLCETVRQTFPLLCHDVYDVPLGHQLIWERFGYRVADAAYAGMDRGRELTLDVRCFDVVRRGTRAAALSLHAQVYWGGVPVATADTRFTVQAPAVYRRLRGEHADAGRAMARAVPVPDPDLRTRAGRDLVRDLVLAPRGADGRQLRVDTTHPLYFDHPVDHVPGMVLLEAVHQSVDGADVTALDCTFHRYVELDSHCTITAGPPGAEHDGHGEPGERHSRITAVQGGEVRFTAAVTSRACAVREAAGSGAR
ncbi:ScbA/BarX family gamma-butyrolactone biosynthesis protein [Streptomyces sp. NPDC004232]|uniref:ScbA/BarX family gamma-butyrolactone biosynthesis protein n=1 Tax=unclassified Streptomyces TaxID=2593676 RepID=UPI001DC4142A|nr:transcriptional regulator [Streptomyces sp. tea 10]